MPTKVKNSISELLTAVDIAITNTLKDPEIIGMVGKFGYTEEKLQEGKNLLDIAMQAVKNKTAIAGNQFQATEELKKAEKEAYDAYQSLVKVAKAAWMNDKAKLAQIGVTGPMPKRIADFLVKAYTVFDNILNTPELKEDLSHFGYDENKLNSEREKIVRYDQANQKQEAAKGAAQQATKDQEVALKNLNGWFSQYVKIARVALKDRKQLLEKIGILVYSNKTPAQRQAPQKAAATRKQKKTE